LSSEYLLSIHVYPSFPFLQLHHPSEETNMDWVGSFTAQRGLDSGAYKQECLQYDLYKVYI
jgi:hypothetical protein